MPKKANFLRFQNPIFCHFLGKCANYIHFTVAVIPFDRNGEINIWNSIVAPESTLLS
jgi:hypothetical protein